MKFASLSLFLSVLVVAVKANGTPKEAVEYFLHECGLPIFKKVLTHDDDEYREHVMQDTIKFSNAFKKRFRGFDFDQTVLDVCREVLNGGHDEVKAAGCAVVMDDVTYKEVWDEEMTKISLVYLQHLGERVLTYDMVVQSVEDFLKTSRGKQYQKGVPTTKLLKLCCELVPKLIKKYGRMQSLTKDEHKIDAACRDLVNTHMPGELPPQHCAYLPEY